jgi:hypothetical protein
MIKNVTLSPEDVQKLTQINASIQHWSIEYTKMMLTVRQMEANANNLYEARNQLLTKVQHDAGIDAKLVEKTILSPGENPSSIVMTIHLQDEEPPSDTVSES